MPELLAVAEEMLQTRSLPNKMDELTPLTQNQRDYRECRIMVLTEMWLMALTRDMDANLDGFQMRRADRTAESGKRKGGGPAVFGNVRWCNSGHISSPFYTASPHYLQSGGSPILCR